MSVYIIRHEERDLNDPLFFSELTINGKNRSNNLNKVLNKLDIDEIYCSPFLRVVQTIYPFCIKYNKLINIDNNLYESMDDKKFNNTNCNYSWKDLPKEYKIIVNKEYVSNCSNIKLYETFEEVCNRVKIFLEKIKDNKLNKNILIVTHLTVCNAILNYINSDIDDKNLIEMGQYIKIDL